MDERLKMINTDKYLDLFLDCVESVHSWFEENKEFLLKLEWFRDNNVGEEIEKQTEEAIEKGNYKIISEAIIPERYKSIFCGNREGFVLCSTLIRLKNNDKFEVNFIIDPDKPNEPRQLYEWESFANEWNELLVWPVSENILPADTVYQSYIALAKNKRLLESYDDVLKIKKKIDKKGFDKIIKLCQSVEHKIKENILLENESENKYFNQQKFKKLKNYSKYCINKNITIYL